ncbi:MAG TPA: presqualene diphosphate synthase HpnD, partial [Verrucomicrobiae bacterium]|nr:presqualene diphosphate synthase HpnD [Verrucomicrobiae bacterium]
MQHTRAITRKSASNLALAFVLLPREKRDAMSALYAFCREIDDVADDESIPVETRRRELAKWREDLASCYEPADLKSPCLPTNRELRPVIARYSLPFSLFDELIRGVEMDLDIKRYETFDDLEQYCYRVASVVGLLSIEIFGYKNPDCRLYADHLGKALQLTNILRDVRTDAARGRIYLPLKELALHAVSERDILNLNYSERFYVLAQSVAARAREHYAAARKALPSEDRHAMASAELMATVYWNLLRKLERRRFNVFGPSPTRLGKTKKLLLIARAW